MTCKCGSDRIIYVNVKCSDTCFVRYQGEDRDGYAPYDIGIGGGDYVHFNYCADCGTIQGEFPLPSNILVEEDED